jgi:hypothetical protein
VPHADEWRAGHIGTLERAGDARQVPKSGLQRGCRPSLLCNVGAVRIASSINIHSSLRFDFLRGPGGSWLVHPPPRRRVREWRRRRPGERLRLITPGLLPACIGNRPLNVTIDVVVSSEFLDAQQHPTATASPRSPSVCFSIHECVSACSAGA